MLYTIGLTIISIASGLRYGWHIGWMILGGGFILAAVIEYLNDTIKR